MLIQFYSNNKIFRNKGYATENTYDNYPVLNVPKDIAADYCKLRTEMVTHLGINDKKYSIAKNLANKIGYSQATKKELMTAKDYFSDSNQLTTFGGKIFKIKDLDQSLDYKVFPITEVTLNDELFNDDQNFDYSGFRCVCEIKK